LFLCTLLSNDPKMKIAILTALVAGLPAVSAQLHALAKNAGLLYFGTAVSPGDSRDSPYYKLSNDINNFGQYTPDNAQKWDATEPQRGRFQYSQADAIVSRAIANKMIMRCHTLVWYSQLPSWGALALIFPPQPRRLPCPLSKLIVNGQQCPPDRGPRIP
jgi:GH35 family endo-1,4-beta-xylanase